MSVPRIIVTYFRCLLMRVTNRFAWVIRPPIIMNGIPRPSEYARSKLNETLGVVAASVKIAPKIGPTQGVHPPANASPKINDNGKLAPDLVGRIFLSKFNLLILELNIINEPNPIIIIPPIWLKFEIKFNAFDATVEFIVTPITENTIENPKTKNIVLSITFALLIKIFDVWLDFDKSEIVVPEIYAKNAGTIGKIHGAKNDPSPAIKATKIVTSLILCFLFFELLILFNHHLLFIQDIFEKHMNSRFIIVGIALGIIVAVAAIVGSPAGPVGIDSMK